MPPSTLAHPDVADMPRATAANTTPERRGTKRWFVLLLISLMYLITYLDRVNMSTAAPVISKEFGFDKITMGVIFSAFVWSYALFQFPAAGSATVSGRAGC